MAINFFNSLAVGTNVLYVDTLNDRVGVGTTNPTRQLTIFDSTGARLALTSGSSANCNILFGDTANDNKGSIRFANSNSSFEHRASIFDFQAQGSSALYINSSRNVGIGTTSPSHNLTINSATGGQLQFQYNTSSRLRIEADSGGGSYYAAAGFYHRFFTSGVERLRIDSSGEVSVYNDFIIDNGSPEMYFKTGGTHYRWMIAAQENVNAALEITPSTTVGGSTYSTPVAVFKATGEVGIGTTSPSSLLNIKGSNGQFLIQNGGAANQMRISSFNNAGNADGAIIFEGYTKEYARIDTSGNVGIGTTSPGGKLHVKDSSTSPGVIIESDGGNEQFVIKRYSNTNEQLILGFHSSDYGTIQAVEQGVSYRNLALNALGGNVGIGTSSPGVKLQVAGYITGDNWISVNKDGASTTSEEAGFRWQYNGATQYWFYTDNSGNGDLRLQAAGLSGENDATPRFIIPRTTKDIYLGVSGGNVGIGTSSPASKLHIQNSAGGSGGYLKITDVTYGGDARFGMADGVNNDVILGSWTNNSILVYTNTAERARITNTGNVGINTTGPAEKLQVVGNIGVGDGTYNGGVYANSSSTAVDTNWGFDFLKTTGQNDYSTRLKYYPVTGESRKAGIWNSRNNTWVLYGDSNNTPNVIIPSGSLRAPIFYDSDNTSYYIDPASTGIAAYLRGDIEIINEQPLLELNDYTATNTTNLNAWVSFQYNGTEGGYVGFGSAGNSNLYLYNYSGSVLINGSSAETNNSFRAPIFYDSNNTGYYMDPASTSIVNTVTANDALQAYHIGIRNTSNGTKDGISLYGGATGGEPTYGLMFTGTSGSGTHGDVTGDWATYFTMNNDNSRGWIFRRVGSGNSASISAGGVGTFDSSVKSPTFYDSNNTAYYTDPAGTSNLNAATFAGDIKTEGPDGGLVLRLWTGNTSYGMLGTANMSGSEYSLLTDGTDTFISGGASGSVYLRAGNNYSNNQLELNSSKARFYGDVQSDDQFINNGNGFKSLNFRGMVGDYDTNGTAAKIIWTIGDSWNTTGNMYGLAYEYNGTYGHHLALKENGTTYQRISFYSGVDFTGTAIASNDFRAPIFYDLNNTSYYTDPAGTSNLNVLTVPGSITMGTVSGAPTSTRLKIAGIGNGGCALFIEGASTTSNVRMTLPTFGTGIYIDNIGAFGANALNFARNGTNAGEIIINSGGTTSYSTTSDYRLKENVVKLTNGIERVKQLKPKRFNFILDENKEIIDGFIAHEAKEVVPESVNGEKDEVLPNGDPVYQGIDQAKLVPLLTAALQEAIAKIEDLETRIQILEN